VTEAKSTGVPDQWNLESTVLHKRRDLELAMRGSIERGLVELITNADDSYRDLEEQEAHVGGKIRIEIQRKRKGPTKVVVKDRACGMTRAELHRNLGELGRRTSGFEKGKARRGLHGRGARDLAAFGPVQFESVKEGRYNRLIISRDLTCRFEGQTRTATSEIRDELGIPKPGSGTVVTVQVNENFRIPLHKTLESEFPRYYSLRDILSNPEREVTLVDLNSRLQSRLLYVYPAGEEVFEGDVAIPDYPAADAHLVIRRHKSAFEMGEQLPYREGILVKSAVAIHDCTYFGIDSEPLAWRFTGELSCRFIDQLVRDYDDREEKNPDNPNHPEGNPTRLLNPHRDGLLGEHPFAQALYRSCAAVLRPLVEDLRAAEEPRRRSVSDEGLDRKLSRLSTKISKLFEEKAKALDEDIPAGRTDTGVIEELSVGLHIIPPGEHPIVLDEPKTFSVVVKHYEVLPDGLSVSVTSSHPDEVSIRSSPVPLRRFSEDGKVGRATFTVCGAKVGIEAIIEARCSGFEDLLLLTVTEPPPPPELPVGLSFEKPMYRLRINRDKALLLTLRAPSPATQQIYATVGSNHSQIIVKGGGRCVLRSSDTPGVLKGRVRVLGRELKARSQISAVVEGFPPAKTDVVVEERVAKSGVRLRFEPVEDNFGVVRYMWDSKNPDLLKIGATHPSIRKYLGQPEDGRYPGVDSDLYHSVLAEVIAEALAFRLLKGYFDREGQGLLDCASADAYYHMEFSDFVSVAHEILVTPTSGN
jgi:hypothetical protein